MAFDQNTRNRLQKFVSNARAILSEEFTRQLQATYGLDPKEGSIAAIDSLTHLDNRQRQTAHLLRETLAHYLATTPGKGEKDRIKQVLDRIVREQAFTVLNRLAALRMAEARGFLLESIAKAHSSKGFQLYRQLSGTAHGETGDAYRNYLFSLFDEFSLDLAVLFDRHSAQGRLFPRESALLELLAEINHHEIEHLWAEDETIGWIYQYFNSQEERKKMRAESQSPRNSRELAVRNQFFTPRYVVEFLTDNTLGRIWYEMTQGNTSLVDSCRYLVRRPTEVFLKPGETAPETEASYTEVLSQEELLKQPVYIPHRPLKDPRSIRMLDPACGSMHFGLYAFDLFERIYLEAWQLEQQLGPGAFTREAGQQSLQSTFDSLETFKQQIPKLIIEHNIHGVDIDPRAVQIAGLSLWQRAQRAWHQQSIKPQQRPTIVKSNIVCAEPMPGEKALLQEFTSKLNPPVLGQLLEVIFDKMQLAGEAGTLLKIEEEIQTAIHEAREQWLKQSGSNSVGDLFQAEKDAATPQAKLGFDLRGIDDESFWDDAEQRILQALSDYADQAESNADLKRLFAEDASKGFAFIDLCRKRFDVLLMNPPFGEASSSTEKYVAKTYTNWSKNILCAFFIRMKALAHENGHIGSIFDRTVSIKSSYEEFRKEIFTGFIENCLDTGWGTLDANVETTCYTLSCISSIRHGTFLDLRDVPPEQRENQSLDISNSSPIARKYIRRSIDFMKLPNSVISYDFPDFAINAFNDFKSLEYSGLQARQGHALVSEQHFRNYWEAPIDEVNDSYYLLYNGGSYKPFYMPDFQLAYKSPREDLWRTNGSVVLRNNEYQLFYGVAYGKRGEYLDVHPLKSGHIFTTEGQAFTKIDDKLIKPLIAYLNSPTAQFLINLYCGQHKYSGYLNLLPWPDFEKDEIEVINSKVQELLNILNELSSLNETTLDFRGLDFFGEKKLARWNDQFEQFVAGINNAAIRLSDKLNSIIEFKFGLSSKETSNLKLFEARRPPFNPKELIGFELNKDESLRAVQSFFVGLAFKRWSGKRIHTEDYSLVCASNVPAALSTEDNHNHFVVMDSDQLTSTFKDIGCNFFEDFENNHLLNQDDNFKRKCFFFDYHINRYSTGRISPIYWPLQTPSGSYTLWVYYHRLNEQTLYTCVNDFIDGPSGKLTQVEQDLNSLRNKSSRSSQEEKELAKLTDLEAELKDFRDELLRLAKFWKPNLNDGVQITAAPLWKLFQHKAWQKKLKETWEKLEKGEYDWAYLACSIWPERVLRKCHQDRSLAIAHDVEDHFWHEVEVPVKRGKKLTGETKLEWQPKDLSESELNALVKKLAAEVK